VFNHFLPLTMWTSTAPFLTFYDTAFCIDDSKLNFRRQMFELTTPVALVNVELYIRRLMFESTTSVALINMELYFR
jgi:hypothetical protein